MKKIGTLLAAAFMTAFISGCSCTNDEYDTSNLPEDQLKIVVIEENLVPDLKLLNIYKWKTEAGIEKIVVRARLNRQCFLGWVFNSYETVKVAYRFTWSDAKGKTVSVGKWQSADIMPGDEFGFASEAPAKGIVNVKLNVKLAEDSDNTKPAQIPAKNNKTTEK